MDDRALRRRADATLISSWALYARGARGAVVGGPGVVAAVFPHGPEREVYNNALLAAGLPAGARATAVATMEDRYAAAGVTRYAAWVEETDGPLRRDLERRGYVLDTTTRAMARRLDDLSRAAVRPEPLPWPAYLAAANLPPGLLADPATPRPPAVRDPGPLGAPRPPVVRDPGPLAADQPTLRPLGIRDGGRVVATALTHDHDGDCGIYNLLTVAGARRRGFGTALTLGLLHGARDRGCTTASLQSTPMAEGLYAAAGFRDLGRVLEYVPGPWQHAEVGTTSGAGG